LERELRVEKRCLCPNLGYDAENLSESHDRQLGLNRNLAAADRQE